MYDKHSTHIHIHSQVHEDTVTKAFGPGAMHIYNFGKQHEGPLKGMCITLESSFVDVALVDDTEDGTDPDMVGVYTFSLNDIANFWEIYNGEPYTAVDTDTKQCMCGEVLGDGEQACYSCLAEMDRAADILEAL